MAYTADEQAGVEAATAAQATEDATTVTEMSAFVEALVDGTVLTDATRASLVSAFEGVLTTRLAAATAAAGVAAAAALA